MSLFIEFVILCGFSGLEGRQTQYLQKKKCKALWAPTFSTLLPPSSSVWWGYYYSPKLCDSKIYCPWTYFCHDIFLALLRKARPPPQLCALEALTVKNES